MEKRLTTLLVFALLLLPAISAAEPAFVFKQNNQVDLCVEIFNENLSLATEATTCFLILKNPQMNITIPSKLMKFDSPGRFCYDINASKLDVLGEYPTTVTCNSSIDNLFLSFTTLITPTGDATPESMLIVFAVILLVMFGISCLFLFLAFRIEDSPLKTFFWLASFIFLLGTMLTALAIGYNINPVSAINKVILGITYVLGIITFLMFALVLIGRIIAAMDMLREKKGYER